MACRCTVRPVAVGSASVIEWVEWIESGVVVIEVAAAAAVITGQYQFFLRRDIERSRVSGQD